MVFRTGLNSRHLILAWALWAWACVALANTGARFVSTAGDPVGAGLTQTLLPPDFSVRGSLDESSRSMVVSVDGDGAAWGLVFTAPTGSSLEARRYAGVQSSASPVAAAMSITGGHGSCWYGVEGWFRIYEIAVRPDGSVNRLALDFVQRCSGSTSPLYGSIRINSTRPVGIPPLVAVAGNDAWALAGETVKLDGAFSFTSDGSRLRHAWTQVSGPEVTLRGRTTAAPTFRAPTEIPLAGVALRFRLQVSGRNGRVDEDDVVVVIGSPSAPRTEVRVDSDQGDYIFGGGRFLFRPPAAQVGVSRTYSGGVSVSFSDSPSGFGWDLRVMPATGKTLRKGRYPGAERFASDTSPGIDLSGQGRGCNQTAGEFTVHQLRTDPLGEIRRLELTFVQRCEAGVAGARGRVLLNAVPVSEQARQVRVARAQFAAEDAAAQR
jgi:hypothetical protein